MPIEREIIILTGDHGTWSLTCATCPKHPYQDALGIPREICAAGVITNAQGAVSLRACRCYVPESIKERDLKHCIICTFHPL